MTQATTSDRPLPVQSGRRRRRFGLAAAALGAALLGSTVAPTDAEAAVPRVLRPGTRPMQFLFGFGPSWGIGGASHYYGPDYYAPGCGAPGIPCRYGGFGYWGSFKLTQEFSGHFSGNASGPALVVCMGLSGSGKTTLASMLAERTGFELLSSDEIRKRRAGLDPRQPTPRHLTLELYAPEARRAVYRDIAAAAEAALARGTPVIADATFTARADRDLALPPDRRGSSIVFDGHHLESSVQAVLPEVFVPKYERKPFK